MTVNVIIKLVNGEVVQEFMLEDGVTVGAVWATICQIGPKFRSGMLYKDDGYVLVYEPEKQVQNCNITMHMSKLSSIKYSNSIRRTMKAKNVLFVSDIESTSESSCVSSDENCSVNDKSILGMSTSSNVDC